MKNSVFMIPLGADFVLYWGYFQEETVQAGACVPSSWLLPRSPCGGKKPSANKCRRASEGDAIHMH